MTKLLKCFIQQLAETDISNHNTHYAGIVACMDLDQVYARAHNKHNMAWKQVL